MIIWKAELEQTCTYIMQVMEMMSSIIMIVAKNE